MKKLNLKSRQKKLEGILRRHIAHTPALVTLTAII